ncbi:MAG TPA: response regulator, partial [Chroococcidiopsis sp.]
VTDVTDVTLELARIWERHRAGYLSRLAIVTQAIEAIATGQFDPERHQSAIREAHTLAGSLGSFGLGRASQLARHIEQALQSVDALTEAQIQQLQATVAEVERAIAPPAAAVSDGVSDAVSATFSDAASTESAPTAVPGTLPGVAPGTVPATVPVPVPAILSPTLPSILPRRLPSSAAHATLLIVDDDPSFIHGVSIAAIAHNITTQSATSHAEARRVIRGARPDVVLLDLSLPNASEDGMTLLHELTSQTPPIPVVVFTATEQFADRIKVARMGGQGFLHKPIAPADAVGAIAQVLHQVERPDAKLLIVDDDPALLDFLRTLLNPWGFRLSLLDDPQQFWHTLEQFQPDLLILDIERPSFSGIDLCRVVRNDPRWSELPVLFLSVHTDAQTLTAVFSAGADDYVTKPIVGPELIARILNRLERTQILRQLGRYSTPGL